MAAVNPYILFNGNCEAAFNYYKSVFGGDFTMLSRFSEMPPQEGVELSDEDGKLIMHVSLPVGEGTILMGSDAGGESAPEVVVGNNITISITAESKEQADLLFKGLSDGGKVTMPLDNTFWGSYFGMCTDQFDVNWMISFGESQEN